MENSTSNVESIFSSCRDPPPNCQLVYLQRLVGAEHHCLLPSQSPNKLMAFKVNLPHSPSISPACLHLISQDGSPNPNTLRSAPSNIYKASEMISSLVKCFWTSFNQDKSSLKWNKGVLSPFRVEDTEVTQFRGPPCSFNSLVES